MAGKQVLRIETRDRLRLGNARHVAALVRGARPAVHALLCASGAWDRLMGWAPFRAWAEKAPGGVVADVDGAIETDRARRAPAAGMAR